MPKSLAKTIILIVLMTLVSACGPAATVVTPTAALALPSPTSTPVLFTETTTPQPTKAASPTESVTPIPKGSEPTAGSVAFSDSGQELGNGRSTDLALGDLDGDGDLDAMVGNEGQAQVWLNDGQGRFSPNGEDLTIPSGWNMGLDLGDLDGDSDLDAFVVVATGSGWVLLNQGGAQRGIAGSFADSGQQLVASSGFGFDLDLGDIDGDGDLDAYVAHERANLVWLNDGQGGFQDSGQRLGEAITADVALADLDGDGDLDALVGGWDEPARVWLNDSQGTFVDSGHILTAATVHIHGLDVGDLDGDGDLDVFLALASGHPNQVWFNDGQGVFGDSGQQLPSALGHAVVLGDLDGDSDLDALMANAASSAGAPNTVWLNDGQGYFRDSGLRLGNGISYGVDLGDLDGDGDLDAFFANNSPPNAVWLNEWYQAAPPSQAIISADTADQVERLQTLSAHTDRAYGLAFSSDGRLLASGSWDDTIRLWDVETWQQVGLVNQGGGWQVFFVPDDAHVASAKGTIVDIASGEIVHTLEGRNPHVTFSPDGAWMASAGYNAPIDIWNVKAWQVVQTLAGHSDRVFGLAFSPDGRLLASGSGMGPSDVSDFVVKVWDITSGSEVHTLKGHRGDVHAVAFSPDGTLVASASTDYTVRVWDVRSGALVHTLRHENGLYGVAFSPDGTLLAAAGCDRTVKLWDVANGRLLRSLPHADEVMTVAFSPDGKLLASGGYDHQIYLWGVSR
jgi:WD40 repeat protein